MRYCGCDVDVQAGARLGPDDLLRGALQQRHVSVELIVVEVTDDRHDPGTSGRAGQLVRMDEALAAGGGLGGETVGGKRRHDPSGEPERVDELARGLSRVHVDPLDGDRHLDGAERLVLELADLRAVDRVGAERAEPLDVEQGGALADLLIGRERDLQARVAAARGAPPGTRRRS